MEGEVKKGVTPPQKKEGRHSTVSAILPSFLGLQASAICAPNYSIPSIRVIFWVIQMHGPSLSSDTSRTYFGKYSANGVPSRILKTTVPISCYDLMVLLLNPLLCLCLFLSNENSRVEKSEKERGRKRGDSFLFPSLSQTAVKHHSKRLRMH